MIVQEPRADTSAEPLLATRGRRLGAALLDAVFIAVPASLVEYFSGFWGAFHAAIKTSRLTHIPYPDEFRLTALAYGLATFLVVQSYPLMASGQTWGKRILHIKIVNMYGIKPSMSYLLGLRELPKWIVSAIPIIAYPLIWLDILLIFRRDRRCGHDLLAGTRVVEVPKIA